MLAAAMKGLLTDPGCRYQGGRLQRRIHARPPVDVLVDDIVALSC